MNLNPFATGSKAPTILTRGRPQWLLDAYADPESFWTKHVAQLSDAAPGTCRSAIFQWYSLFDELGARHVSGARPAFTEYSQATGFESTSYATLVARATVIASHWGCVRKAKQATVVLVLEMGPGIVACGLAAWHCGAAVCVVPPRGPGFVRHCLEQLLLADGVAPDGLFVVTGMEATPWIREIGGLTQLEWEMNAMSIESSKSIPHRFDANEVAIRCFSHLTPKWGPPVPLSAEQLYLGALRDGLMVLELRASEGLAAPGFCDVQYQPWLLWVCLASGANFVHLDAEDVGTGAKLFGGPIQTLGVSVQLRDVLLERGQFPSPVGIRHWFRDVAEDLDVTRWMQLGARFGAAEVLGMNYFANAAAGGTIVYSVWSRQPAASGVWRAPGLPCDMIEPNGTGMPSLADLGMLSPNPKLQGQLGVRAGLLPESVGQVVLVFSDEQDTWVGNLGSHRGGRFLPEKPIESVLQRRYPGAVRCALLIALPLRRNTSAAHVVLLVYVAPKKRQLLNEVAIKADIAEQLGQASVPDRVEIYDVNPKWKDLKQDAPEVDALACVSQYQSGLLWKKQSRTVFVQLSALADEVRQIRQYRTQLQQLTTNEARDGTTGMYGGHTHVHGGPGASDTAGIR